jgi:hypothetical protein
MPQIFGRFGDVARMVLIKSGPAFELYVTPKGASIWFTDPALFEIWMKLANPEFQPRLSKPLNGFWAQYERAKELTAVRGLTGVQYNPLGLNSPPYPIESFLDELKGLAERSNGFRPGASS